MNPNDRKQFDDDKMAYWDNDEQAIAITNPNDPDGGTAFKPDRGKAYFDEL